MKRRHFIQSALTLTAASTLPSWGMHHKKGKALFSKIGIASSLANAVELKAAGIQFLTENTNRFLVPDQSEEVFLANLELAKAAPLPILACNGFIRPKHLRSVGADARHDEVMIWAEACFRRLSLAGGTFIVFGSSGSRRLRDGWPKEKADEQFVALLKRMGPVARNYGVTVALEQLRAKECNYINHVAEGAAIVRAVDHPNVRQLADFYHMIEMGDTPEDLAQAMDVIVHVEIAEPDGRSVPGVNNYDFRPYFKVLQDHNYTGAISIEGRWEMDQIAQAVKTIREQSA